MSAPASIKPSVVSRQSRHSAYSHFSWSRCAETSRPEHTLGHASAGYEPSWTNRRHCRDRCRHPGGHSDLAVAAIRWIPPPRGVVKYLLDVHVVLVAEVPSTIWRALDTFDSRARSAQREWRRWAQEAPEGAPGQQCAR